MAFNWMTNELYWTNVRGGWIRKASGSNIASPVTVKAGLGKPRGIAVDPFCG